MILSAGRCIVAVTTALALVGAGCASNASAPPSDGSVDAAADSADPADLVAAGVGVVATGCAGPTNELGSGVIVGVPGEVVTTAHTVAGASSVSVIDSAGDEFTATVVAFDKDADLALLQVDGLDAQPLDVGEAQLGDATAVVWSRELGVHGLQVEVTKRLDITIEDIFVEDTVSRTGIELQGEITTGDSGGAIIDRTGDVIGIIYARSRQRPGVAFATDHAELAGLLADRPMAGFDRCN